MLKLRIEFYGETERMALINHLQERFNIVNEGKVKPSKLEGCNLKIQYVEVVEKDAVH